MVRSGALTALMAVLIGAAGCDQDPPDTAPTTPPRPSTSVAALLPWQAPMSRPTGLRVLIDDRLIDVDTGLVSPRELNHWLSPVVGPPIFIGSQNSTPSAQLGVGLTTSEGNLPGGEPIMWLRGATNLSSLAASTDGKSVWYIEYISKTRCTLNELWLDGRTKRQPRIVPCGWETVAQTSAGLWVKRGKSWYETDGHMTEFTEREPTYALLDPDTLAQRETYPEVRILGRDHVLTMDDRETGMVLRGPAGSVALDKPSVYSGYVFNGHRPVMAVSPDGRYALYRFGSHSQSPQIIDVWVLDLEKAAWLHVPGMPVEGSLKYASEAWSADGRLVMIGLYTQDDDAAIFGTWRPGDAKVAVLPSNPVPPNVFDQGFGPIFVW